MALLLLLEDRVDIGAAHYLTPALVTGRELIPSLSSSRRLHNLARGSFLATNGT